MMTELFKFFCRGLNYPVCKFIRKQLITSCGGQVLILEFLNPCFPLFDKIQSSFFTFCDLHNLLCLENNEIIPLVYNSYIPFFQTSGLLLSFEKKWYFLLWWLLHAHKIFYEILLIFFGSNTLIAVLWGWDGYQS